MITLKKSQTLQAVMSGAANTTNPDFVTSYKDQGQRNTNNGTLSGTTAVALATALTLDDQRRNVDGVNIYNADDATVTVTVQIYDDSADSGAVTRKLVNVSILTGETLFYANGAWGVINANGSLKQAHVDTTVDLNGASDALIYDADGDSSEDAPTDDVVVLKVGGSDVRVVTKLSANEHGTYTIKSPLIVDNSEMVVYEDDFTRKAFDETNENWILNSGSDDLAVDPAIVIAANGTCFLDAGDGDGTIAADGSQMVWAIPVQAGYGGLFFEAVLHIEDITGVSVNVGFTDVTTLEEPFSIAAGSVTSVATNAVAFVFDDGATTKEWYACGVDGDTDATGQGATGVAPVNGTYQTFRCEIDADGEGAKFYINGTLVKTLTAAVCAAATDLYFTVVVCGDGGNAAAVGVTVDRVKFGHTRAA